MHRRLRRLAAAAAVAVVSTAALLFAASPATAGLYPCRSNGNAFTVYNIYWYTATWWDVVSARTTDNCNDIQVKLDGGTPDYDYMCVVFTNITNNCNYATAVPENMTWVNIATNVADNVPYTIRIYFRNGRIGRHGVTYAG
jgi:hypothetical protein